MKEGLLSIRKLFLTALIFLFLTGCKLDISADLNVGDLHHVALSKQNGVASTGTIKFEVGSIANCGDESEFFTFILEKHFLEFKILPCEQVGVETYFVAAIKIPILFTHIDWPEKTNSLIAINAGPSNTIGGIDVELLLNQDRFRSINKAVESKYFQKFELSRISIELKNDLVSYQNVLASDVFVDSLPVVGNKTIGLSPEKSLTLELSDVKEEYFSLYNRVSLFSLLLSI
jgi:hypothetical protein